MARTKGKGGVGRAIVWVILLLLIVGLAGFGATSFGGSVQTVGTVGDTAIPVTRYARAVEQELRAFEAQTGQRVSFAQAEALGLDRAVLAEVIATTALEDEADDLGISVGDAEIAREVARVPAFQGIDGSFDRDAYVFALDRSGQSIAEFEETVRAETARTLLQGAVVSGVTAPAAFVDILFDYARERRDITYATLTRDDLSDPPADPTDAQLRAYHEANAAAFTLPERRAITYAWIRPEMISDTVGVGDDELRRLYADRIDQYQQPERRLVERLVFASAADAEAAAAAIASGDTTFDAAVTARGLTLADVDLGDVARDDLGPAADAVFALAGPGVVGPVDTPLGPALMRMNGILAAQEVPFEAAREELLAEAALDTARRAIEDEIEAVDDLLAGGATLEEVAAETPLELGQMLWDPGTASVAGADVDAYPEVREAAAAAEIGDFPEVIVLSDGGILALRLDEIVPPTVQPFDEVRDAVAAAWDANEVRTRLIALARTAVDLGDPLEAGRVDPVVETGLTRDGFVGGVPEALVSAAFEMAPGELRVVEGDPGTDIAAVILRVDAVTPPDAAAPESAEVKRQFAERTAQGIAQDIMGAFAAALQAEKGIRIDQPAIAAVHAQFP